jgi:CHASE3 domain sensor protein
MKLSTRLAFGFGGMLAIIILIIGFSFNTSSKLNYSLSGIQEINRSTNLHNKIVISLKTISENIKTIILYNDPETVNLALDNIKNARHELNQSIAAIEEMLIKRDNSNSKKAKAGIDSLKDAIVRATLLENQILELVPAHKNKKALDILANQIQPIYNAIYANINQSSTMLKQSNNLFLTMSSRERIFLYFYYCFLV